MLVTAACSKKVFLSNTNASLYPVSRDMPTDSALVKFLQPYKAHLDSQMWDVIAVSDKVIERGRPEGALNNLMADAMFIVGRENGMDFDVAYTNYGGLRLPLPEGPIRLFNVYELMPFENRLTTVRFKGSDMKLFFDYIAGMGGDPISGAAFKIRDKKAEEITIGGKPLDMSGEYTVLTSDYMANGGDGGDIFFKSFGRKEYPIKLRDAIVTYLKEQTKAGNKINPKVDGRITVE
ncbi:MAG TPA: 5'-nucleotidase C-terminal domain-containing protein [Sphingobacteriaceae bacterium]